MRCTLLSAMRFDVQTSVPMQCHWHAVQCTLTMNKRCVLLPQLAMLGGNQRARQFFKQHGWYELGADKIEAKYTSRAAVLYKVRRQHGSAVCLYSSVLASNPC